MSTSGPHFWTCQCGVQVPMGCSHTCAHIGPTPGREITVNPPWPTDLIASLQTQLATANERAASAERERPILRELTGQVGLMLSKMRAGEPYDRTREYVWRLLVDLEPDEEGDPPYDRDYDELLATAESRLAAATAVVDAARDFLAWARRFRAGDPKLDPEEWYVESESLANLLKAFDGTTRTEPTEGPRE